MFFRIKHLFPFILNHSNSVFHEMHTTQKGDITFFSIYKLSFVLCKHYKWTNTFLWSKWHVFIINTIGKVCVSSYYGEITCSALLLNCVSFSYSFASLYIGVPHGLWQFTPYFELCNCEMNTCNSAYSSPTTASFLSNHCELF